MSNEDTNSTPENEPVDDTHYGSGWIPFLWILIPFLAVVAYGYFS